MKKFLSLVLSLTMLLSLAASASAVDLSDYNLYPRFPFKDTPYTNWYFEAIRYVSENEIMNGVEKNVFSPDEGMTRAEFVTTLCRVSGGDEDPAAGASAFSDVPESSWFAGYIGWGVKNSVMKGFPDGTFMPNAKINRQEMVAALNRYLVSAGYVLPDAENAVVSFKDLDQVADWAAEHLEALRKSGLIAGDADGRFCPNSGMTRAEAATALARLCEAIKNASAPEYRAWGAYSLYCSLGAFVGGDDDFVDGAGKYPLYCSKTSSFKFDMGGLWTSPGTYPVLKLVYSGGSDKATVTVGNIKKSASASTDDGMKVMSVRLASEQNDLTYDDDVIVDFGAESDVSVLYAAFSKNEEISASLNAEKLSDVLSSNPMSGVSYSEASDELVRSYEEKGNKRINEIMNAKDVDPSTIKGKCYYISSVRGDDGNSGTSPDSPWKTIKNLYTIKGGGSVVNSKVEPGDGVFFERGSRFYGNEILKTNGGGYRALTITPGVTYSAYGSGDKPLFSHELQTSSPSGKWVKTDTPNVWKLDETLPYREDVPAYFEIAAIIMNSESDPDNVMWGLRTAIYDDNPFPANENFDRGIVTNGRDVFRHYGQFTGLDCLKNNLEFYYDRSVPALYMNCADGNPGEVFGDIKFSLAGDIIAGGGDKNKNTVVDNISVKYGARHGMAINGDNLTVQNCEIGWIGGQDIGNGIENWGDTVNYTVKNCYLYQCYDDCVTSQFGGNSPDGSGVLMENILFKDNVLTHTTAAFELWNCTYGKDGGEQHQDITQTSITKNAEISGNYMMYMGYGFGHQRYYEYIREKMGTGIECSGFSHQQFSNVVVKNNVTVHSGKAVEIMQLHTPGVGNPTTSVRGVKLMNNTYVMSNTGYYIGTDLDMRIPRNYYVKYAPRELGYFASFGIEEGSKFYFYDGYLFPEEADGLYR